MSNQERKTAKKRKRHFEVLLILLFCQSCTFFVSPAKEKADLGPVESLMDQEEEKLTTALPVIQVENLAKKRDWEEVHKAVNEWDYNDSDVEREFKTQVNAVKGFCRASDHCREQENAFSRSATLDCYKKIIKHQWRFIPKQTYFTRSFASELNSQKNMILAKIKEMEKVRKKKRHQPRKKTTAQEFFDAYYQCFKLERTSPDSLNELISCYQEAYTIRDNIPRRITYPQKISTDLYTKGIEVTKRIAQLKTQLAEKEEKREADKNEAKKSPENNKTTEVRL